MDKLKPCPFCGSKNIYINRYEHEAGERWRVICLECMCTIDSGTIQKMALAIEAWNRRI